MEFRLQKIEEKKEFMEMALRYFRELNPAFEPAADWGSCYFENILANPAYSLFWIMVDEARAGFVLYGIEPHRFLPRRAGAIYELYVDPAHRRKGIATVCAQRVLDELRNVPVAKIHLEIVEKNAAARRFWQSLGFKKASERFTLSNESR